MNPIQSSILTATARIEIRFNECDPLGIVWHGNYVNYFQEGREAFGKKYNLSYLDMFQKGFATPIIHLQTDFKKTLQYKDVALVETTLRSTPAAKIIFDYIIKNEKTGDLVCRGTTTQVFVTGTKMELSLTVPEVFAQWKKQYNLE